MAERILDVLIRNATLVDGSGAAPAPRSVGVAEGKIVLEGLGNAKAASTLDAAGLVLAPGFIDAHGHTDLMVNMDPLAAAKLCQGITTEIAGQCGLSLAPVSAEFFPLFKLYFEGWGARLYPNHAELRSVGAFMETMESMKPGINLALFAAHGTLRLAAMGMDPGRPDARQMALMEALAKEAMEAGALGLSSGLMYSPGSFAETEELVALCAAMAPYGAIYTSHIRNQGNELLDSVRETLDVARRAGATANISHHKAVGKSNWGKVSDSIRMIHEEGNATHDVYPYAASSTNLLATLPPSCMKEGLDVLMGQLSDRAYLEELERRIFEPVEKWDNDLLECGYDGILVMSAEATGDAVGLTIAQFAAKRGLEPFAAYALLLRENSLVVGDVCFSMSQDDVDTLVADPLCMFCTDSLYVSGMKMTHPRSIGSFPRILGRCVREKRLLTLEEAIRKMTSLPASRYGLRGKGLVAEGYDADLVLFDPEAILDRADYLSPLVPNEGIARVYVGGALAVLNGKPTGERKGHVLRKGR